MLDNKNDNDLKLIYMYKVPKMLLVFLPSSHQSIRVLTSPLQDMNNILSRKFSWWSNSLFFLMIWMGVYFFAADTEHSSRQKMIEQLTL